MSNWFSMLPEDAFMPRVGGSMRLYGKGGGGSSAPPPDPRLIEAQIKSMGVQDSAIAEYMANARELAPLQKQQMQFGIDSSKTAYDQSQQDRTWMLGRRDMLSGAQDTMAKDAATFNTEAKREELAAQGNADVNAAFTSARGQTARDMARRGVNPSSGAALASSNQLSIAQAAAGAGASNNARTAARTEGRILTDRVTNSLAGYPSMASGASGAGAGYGANGLTIANTGLAGLNSGATSAAGVAGAMGSNAASMYGTMGNYKTGQDHAQGDGGAGMLVGLAGAAATAY